MNLDVLGGLYKFGFLVDTFALRITTSPKCMHLE